MTFAQPLALLLGLLAVPIVLLYLLKQRRRRVLVSTLLFWDQILRDEHTVTSLTKLRKLLSLLLQLLFLLLLVLALARPVLSKEMLGARRVVILLDTSASMTVLEENGKTRFEAAQRKARDVVRGMSMGDTGLLVAVAKGADIVTPFTDSRKELIEGLEATKVTHAATDFADALDLLGHLPPDERPTYVYVITDGALSPVAFSPPEEMRFAYLGVGKAAENMGITAFALRPLPASPRDFEIMFEASNETEEAQTVPFEVRVNDSLVDAGELSIEAGGAQVHSLRQFSPQGGTVEVVLDHEDAFPLDNRAYAVLPEPELIRAVLVTEGNVFLETALITDDAIALETLSPTEYERYVEEGHPHDVILFDRVKPDALPEAHAIFIGAWPEALGLATQGNVEEPIITDWKHDHPINRHLHLVNVTIENALRVPKAEGYEVLVESFDDPLVLLREDSEGAKTMVVAFDTVASDLPLRVAFPILVANAMRYMTGQGLDQAWESVPVGALLSREEMAAYVPEVLAGAEEVALELQSIIPPGISEEGGMDAAVAEVTKVGVYRGLVAEDIELPLFAANLNDRRESRIAPSESMPVLSESPLPVVEDGLRLGVAPWFFLAFVAILLSIAEWVLFHRRLVE